ncbi:urease accessory protein [Cordyceps fumosorosea ARSEF 2679]|uniref:Urease accessory protein n=1 Tax=Cordyceps fumosorosea (strain ARSEF 2679) TaxID=1081104 RepID=A0A167J1N1_CORFA|nr:urease accessory protein [Cordyceps fumosorosea ARSEF 2679]OAA49693.1 urease accessory protein [Cordyceps fumosorosea ARSEF 2679]
MAIQATPMATTAKTTLQPGSAVIAVQAAPDQRSRLRHLSSAYPIKLISPLSPPSSSSSRAVLAFLLSYGGGLVAGDRLALSVTVDPSARLGLLTQGSTKLYRGLPPSRTATVATVRDAAALLLLPDPLQPFCGSAHEQRQTLRLHHRASALLLDWVSEGRPGCDGVVWAPAELRSVTEVWRLPEDEGAPPRLLVRDNLILRGGSVRECVAGLGVVGTVIVGGPLFDGLARFFRDEFAGLPRVGEVDWARDDDDDNDSDSARRRGGGPEVLWSAAAVRGFTVVKFGAGSVDGARRWLRGMLEREGTVAREFGTRFLMCLQDR